jgi:hypothetical protein
LLLINYQSSRWYDAYIQEKEFINFSFYNSYYPLINQSIYNDYRHECETECLPSAENCTSLTGEMSQCNAAQNACDMVDTKYGAYYPDIDPYDIRQKGNGPYFPLDSQDAYLQNPEIMKAIGARANYSDCPDAPGVGFANTADGTLISLSLYPPS